MKIWFSCFPLQLLLCNNIICLKFLEGNFSPAGGFLREKITFGFVSLTPWTMPGTEQAFYTGTLRVGGKERVKVPWHLPGLLPEHLAACHTHELPPGVALVSEMGPSGPSHCGPGSCKGK